MPVIVVTVREKGVCGWGGKGLTEPGGGRSEAHSWDKKGHLDNSEKPLLGAPSFQAVSSAKKGSLNVKLGPRCQSLSGSQDK